MDNKEFEIYLQSNSIKLIEGGKTEMGTYVFIPIQRLDSTANRLNSTWIRAEFIIVNEAREATEAQTDIDKWKKLSIHNDQYLIVNVKPDGWRIYNFEGEFIGNQNAIAKILGDKAIKNNLSELSDSLANHDLYLRAMRTKPFLLLAGISGTGKSRIVKEMAFTSCPPSLAADPVSPGNYCMVEVKPNWHDSTELLGYESVIGGDHYVVTPFINFLIKAWHNPDHPFFVCLDEMNLAPVEQYFAEFLSVLESRKLIDGVIMSEPLIKQELTSKYISNFIDTYRGQKEEKKSIQYNGMATSDDAEEYRTSVFSDIAKYGLRLPPNLIIVGTVNMDETTYQFSRKVIDRAMTIEMNEVDFDSMFDETADTLKYRGDDFADSSNYLPKFTAAKDALAVLDEADIKLLKGKMNDTLKALDDVLKSTPFRIAYRVQNELILYYTALRQEQPDADGETLLATAIDDILMMKVLPRIQGDEENLTEPLTALHAFCAPYQRAQEKVEEMQSRLKHNHFTSFWP